MKIDKIKAYEILDSRGNPTLDVEITAGGNKVSASVPSGASTGMYEAHELRDQDKKRYNGKGVLKAVGNVNTLIAKKIVGKNIRSQKEIDDILIYFDKSEKKKNFGANAILGTSLAFAKAMAKNNKQELYEYFGGLANNKKYKIPTPSFNIINGGKHADSGLDIQEFMIQPIGLKKFSEKLRAGAEIYHSLKTILASKGEIISVGDEGGFAPRLKCNEASFELIITAIKKAGYSSHDIKIGIDSAASSFYEKGYYYIKNRQGKTKKINSIQLVKWYENLVKKYPINSIEDPFEENDWEGFKELTRKVGKKILVIGDDLLVTNITKISRAIEKKAVNSVLIKLNQIGTVSETIKAIEFTKHQKWIPFISHRSGETSDNYIADLAVGLNCQFIKAGAPCRSERTAKYNRLLKIEHLIQWDYSRMLF